MQVYMHTLTQDSHIVSIFCVQFNENRMQSRMSCPESNQYNILKPRKPFCRRFHHQNASSFFYEHAFVQYYLIFNKQKLGLIKYVQIETARKEKFHIIELIV